MGGQRKTANWIQVKMKDHFVPFFLSYNYWLPDTNFRIHELQFMIWKLGHN